MRGLIKITCLTVLLVLVSGVIGYQAAMAQEEPQAAVDEPDENPQAAALEPPGLSQEIPSLLFTFAEQEAIRDARRARGLVRAPTQEEVRQALNTPPSEIRKPKPPPEQRYIRLAGIVYAASDDWTIWLNDRRVTPNALPEEVIDLKVYKEYIELRWFDDYSNQIFPVRLRPHQRFNIDSRIFLPGS